MTVASQEPEVEVAIDFSLTPEQKAIRDMAREFARKEIDPIVEEFDESQEFPRQLFAKAAELGFLGIIFPEKYGGAGLGYVDYVLVINELTKVDPSIGLSVAAHNSLCSNHIFKFGNEEQIQRWLVPLARGEKIGAWSLTGSSTAPRPLPPTARSEISVWCLRLPIPTDRANTASRPLWWRRGPRDFTPAKRRTSWGRGLPTRRRW
jgi:hypothetical protein